MTNVLDLEANELYPFQTNTWVICIKRIETGERLKINPFRLTKDEVRKQILDFIFIEEEPVIAGHNYLGFDAWVLWKDFGLDIRVGPDFFCGRKVKYFDTLYGSQFLLPDRLGGHSLEAWGERIGFHKIPYRKVALEAGIIQPNENEFCRWSLPMEEYCIRDTDVTERVYNMLKLQLDMEESESAFRLGQKTFFLMAAQAYTGFKFDLGKARDLQVRIEGMISDLKKEVEPDLPPRKLKKAEEFFYQIPAKPFLKERGLSATMLNFVVKHKAVVRGDFIDVYGKTVKIEPGVLVLDKLPMLLDDQNELKDYFLSIGWKPTMHNLKKGKDGKPVRDDKGGYIKTSPKIQENGKICENLLELDGELPKKIVKFMSLRNRLGILNGWLEDRRLAWDGRLSAGSSGIANTHRQRHHTIVNVPKAQDDVLLGREFRELFTVEFGNVLVGCDQAALEARCEAHWVWKYPKGVDRAELLLSGDLHSTNAKIFFPEETKQFDIYDSEFSKDHPDFKPYRSLSKNGAYALAYGCTPKKLAQTLRKPEHEAKPLYDAFWDANPSLKSLKDKIEEFWGVKGGKKWIPAIDGRRLHSRSKHSLVNLLFQSTGTIIVDYALCLFDMKMGRLLLDDKGRPYYSYKNRTVKRVAYQHDEAQVECSEDVSEEIGKILEWCMAEAGRRLKLNIPLVGESKIGLTWAEVH